MRIKFLCFLLLVSICLLTACSNNIVECTDISQYIDALGKSRYYGEVFPEKIPDDARVVEFYCYDDYNSHCEAYLELKFDSVDALRGYITELKQMLGEDDIFEQTNPQNTKYTDLYHVAYAGYRGDYRLYSIRWLGSIHSTHYCVTSYSQTDLSVVITYIATEDSKKIPKYFSKFELPIKKGRDFEYEVLIPA